MSQDAFAGVAGQSKKSQIRYESGERSPDGDYFAAIAQAGADITYIVTGYRVPAVVRAIREQFGPALDLGNQVAELVGSQATAAEPEFVPVPVYEAALAAGDGIDNHAEELVGHLAFRRSWLASIGVPATSAVIARAAGDSMTPTIHCGDMLLIDRSKAAAPQAPRGPKDTRPAPIYAILDDGAARVKRVELVPGGTLALLSDNPAFAPEFRPVDAVSIIGKVMWWGHTNRE